MDDALAVMAKLVEFKEAVLPPSIVCCLRTVTASFTMAAAFEAEVNFELSNELVGVNGLILACS